MGSELFVDETKCTGHGRCYSTVPNLLSDDDEGFVTLRGTSMAIEDEQLGDAEQAVAACPERAITLTRSS
ncbi:MAG: ferredoxin [Pseudonocardiales bacterium]|jgi:ferredoxin|nr:ferredoxin [Pseudonocardiales bacterium]